MIQSSKLNKLQSAKCCTSLLLLGFAQACGTDITETFDLQGEYRSTTQKEFSIKARGVGCVAHDLNIQLTKMTINQIIYVDCGSFGKFPKQNEVYFMSYLLAEDTLFLTTLPSEAQDNVGTEDNPAPRNTKTTVEYQRQ